MQSGSDWWISSVARFSGTQIVNPFKMGTLDDSIGSLPDPLDESSVLTRSLISNAGQSAADSGHQQDSVSHHTAVETGVETGVERGLEKGAGHAGSPDVSGNSLASEMVADMMNNPMAALSTVNTNPNRQSVLALLTR
jgi:hypothetical protein